MSIAMSIFSLLGTFIIGFSMLPQTILTMKTKDTAKLSLALYAVMGLATALITIYGIGLVIIPNPATHSDIAISAGSFRFTGEAVFSNESYRHACEQNWVSGFIVPGAAIIFGELLCSTTSFIIAAIKLMNIIKAKKAGMTESEYVEKTYGDIIRAEQEKQENKAPFMDRVKSMLHIGGAK